MCDTSSSRISLSIRRRDCNPFRAIPVVVARAVRYDATRVASAGSEQQAIEASGYVLVGGRSSRFGSPKALHLLDGRAMALRVAEALASRVRTVTLVGDPEQYAVLGMPVIADRIERAGPLAGIVAALHHTPQKWCIVAACDMPFVSAGVVDQLLFAMATASVDAIIPQTPDGRLQPLFAAYAKSGLVAFEHALHRGTRKVADALECVSWTKLPVDDARSFANVNRPSDLSAAG